MNISWLKILLISAISSTLSLGTYAQEKVDPHFGMTQVQLIKELGENPHNVDRDAVLFFVSYIDSRGIEVTYSSMIGEKISNRMDSGDQKWYEETLEHIKNTWKFKGSGQSAMWCANGVQLKKAPTNILS